MDDSEFNFLINPIKLMNNIFEKSNKNEVEWKEEVACIFRKELNKLNNFENIPNLNETPLHKLSNNQIVRFRGMVQDMLDREFYFATYTVIKEDGSKYLMPGRYLDMTPVCQKGEKIEISDGGTTDDRNCYYCISVPGESKWVKDKHNSKNPSSESCFSTCTTSSKRSIDNDDEDLDVNMDFNEDLNNEGSKRTKRELCVSNANVAAKPKDYNFPVPNAEGIACIVKVYDDVDVLKLNEVVDFIGILSMNPLLASNDAQDTDFPEEHNAHCPPPSLVPRLHCLSYNVLQHQHPDLPMKLEDSDTLDPQKALDTRELLGSILEVALLGDGEAAEYLICHLISSVYLRQNVLPLGKFCLNLSGISKELQDQNYPEKLYEIIETLTTHSYFLPMTLLFMNETNFIPKKDYDANRLTSGLLQLPSNCHLVVDETKLTSGQLNASGVKNLTALGQMISWQKVDYDFQYHPLEQLTDVPVFILSEGKSMVTCDCQVPLNPQHTDVSLALSKAHSMLNDQTLDVMRKHLVISRFTPYSLTESMQQKVQDDFVSSRRHDDGMSADDLHLLLCVAKLMAQSVGSLELSESVWKSAKALESTRKGRLRTMK